MVNKHLRDQAEKWKDEILEDEASKEKKTKDDHSEIPEGTKGTSDLIDDREVLESKVIGDSRLELKSWISDSIDPGRRGYQLALVYQNGGFSQYPTDWEDYTEQKIWDMYNSVSSEEDFHRLKLRGSRGGPALYL